MDEPSAVSDATPGERIRDLRERVGLTREQVRKRVGWRSRSQLLYYENGIMPLTPRTEARLLDAIRGLLQDGAAVSDPKASGLSLDDYLDSLGGGR